MNEQTDNQRILIVDDDESICQLLTSILNSKKRVLEVARTIEEARQFLRQEHIDLILLDLYLPDGSGLDLVSELRKKPPASPLPVIIMMTAFGSWESHVQSYNLGAYYFLDKPFKATQLRTLVEAGLEKRSVPRL